MSQPKKRVVIVGGVAGGATAAARLHRLDESLEIIIVEKGRDVSVAGCGLPYAIGGEITDQQKLALQTARSLEQVLKVTVLDQVEVVAIDTKRKLVKLADRRPASPSAPSRPSELTFDFLLLSTGATPFVPPIFKSLLVAPINSSKPKRLPRGIYVLHSLDDMRYIDRHFHDYHVQRCVVLGSGFVGLEVAEQLRHATFRDSLGRETKRREVTLLEGADQVLPIADGDFSDVLSEAVRAAGVNLFVDVRLSGVSIQVDNESIAALEHGSIEQQQCISLDFTATDEDSISNETDLIDPKKKKYNLKTDILIVATGVRPNSQLARDAQLKLGPRGHIRVNPYMLTSHPDIYACGDVAETDDFIFSDESAAVALGNIANQQARIAADHIACRLGLAAVSAPTADSPSSSSSSVAAATCVRAHRYPGSLGTAIVRVFDWTFACSGWSEKRLKQQRPREKYGVVMMCGPKHAEYYPGAGAKLIMKVIYSEADGKILGCQVAGEGDVASGVDKRCDVLATAMFFGATIDQLAQLQLAYSPIFGSARDPINTAGLIGRNLRQRLLVSAKIHGNSSSNKKAQDATNQHHRRHPILFPTEAESRALGKRIVLLDVRLPREVAERPIPGAHQVPYNVLPKPEALAELEKRFDKATTVFRVACVIGRQSYFTSRVLMQNGWSCESVLGGVTVHWRPERPGMWHKRSKL